VLISDLSTAIVI